MHITINLNSHTAEFLRLPRAYLHLFQSLLYGLLPPERAAFLHDGGYRVDGRPMKLFAMSWPISKTAPRISGDRIEYDLPVSVVVSTPVAATMEGLVGGAFKSGELRVGNNLVICESIEAKSVSVQSEKISIKTLSPITCYAQTQRQDGRKFTVYLDPRSPDFEKSVNNNLLRKFRALYPELEAPSGHVEVKPSDDICERVAQFTSGNYFPIKGWSGTFSLKGPRELLQVGVDCGLGAKNSGGWGCVSLL